MAAGLDPSLASARLDAVFRAERGRILATLIAILRDFELAEEALQEACATALSAWARDGVPTNPRAWLVQAAKRRAIDRIRRDSSLARKLQALPAPEGTQSIESQLEKRRPARRRPAAAAVHVLPPGARPGGADRTRAPHARAG